MATIRKAFDVVRVYNSSVKIQSVEKGTVWEVYFEGKFRVSEGDVATILIEEDKFKLIINEMNGDAATIVRKV